MAYDIKSFRAWATYYDVAQELTPKDQGVFYRAIFEYMFAGNDLEEELPKVAKICFKSIKPNLKRSKSKAKNDDVSSDFDADLVRSTSNETETKNALNLNSNINSNSKAAGAESAARFNAASTPPKCPACGRAGEWNDHMKWWECPECVARLA